MALLQCNRVFWGEGGGGGETLLQTSVVEQAVELEDQTTEWVKF